MSIFVYNIIRVMSLDVVQADNICSIEQLQPPRILRYNGIVPLRFRNSVVTPIKLPQRSQPLLLGDLMQILYKKSMKFTGLDENKKMGQKMLHNKIVTKINYLIILYPGSVDLSYVLLCHITSAKQRYDVHKMHLIALHSSLNCILKHSTNLQDMMTSLDPVKNNKYYKLSITDILSLKTTIVAQKKIIDDLLQNHRALMGHFL